MAYCPILLISGDDIQNRQVYAFVKPGSHANAHCHECHAVGKVRAATEAQEEVMKEHIRAAITVAYIHAKMLDRLFLLRHRSRLR